MNQELYPYTFPFLYIHSASIHFSLWFISIVGTFWTKPEGAEGALPPTLFTSLQSQTHMEQRGISTPTYPLWSYLQTTPADGPPKWQPRGHRCICTFRLVISIVGSFSTKSKGAEGALPPTLFPTVRSIDVCFLTKTDPYGASVFEQKLSLSRLIY